MQKFSNASIAATVLIACAFQPAFAATVTYQFEAVYNGSLGPFETGDTISGQYTLDDTLTEQNSPIASISYVFTDVSTGRTATGGTDPAANAGPDLVISVINNDESNRFFNLITEPNTVFNSGISFDEINIRFQNDLPAYVTMAIFVGSTNNAPFGPNFILTSVEQVMLSEVPLPAAFPLFLVGLAGFAGLRRLRSKAR